MTFDPKALIMSPSFATAGAFVVALGIFHLINTTFTELIRPIFNFINETGRIRLWAHAYIDCGTFLTGCIVCVVAVVVGGMMIRIGGRS